jgi:DNA polymerase-3 subunit delta'
MDDSSEFFLPRLPWHHSAWETIQKVIHEDRLSHALLLTGPEGVGKARFAYQLIASLLCHSPKKEIEACGECKGCQMLKGGTHPDFRDISVDIHLSESEKAKASRKDKNKKPASIKIEQVREIIQFVSMSSFFKRHKLVFIPEAHLMNRNAANALLKTLEEPPPMNCLILTSSRPFLLPQTIRSRTQQMNFAHPPKETAHEWLSEQVSQERALEFLGFSLGSPLKAIDPEVERLIDSRKKIFALFFAILERKKHPVEASAEWVKEAGYVTLDWLESWISDLIRIQQGGSDKQLLNVDLVVPLRKLSVSLSLLDLFEFFDRVKDIRASLVHNIDLRLSLETMFIRMTSSS